MQIRPCLTAISLLISTSVIADISFTDVSHNAGIDDNSITFGASWGDMNADGWPDLWIGNHYEGKPALYINQKNGQFVNISNRMNILSNDDSHGAAWADFDNDGDQDIVELTGASYGSGEGPNHLFVNTDLILTDQATQRGVNYPRARGRTPLWLDANSDGLLDLILVNMPRKDGQGKTALLKQNRDHTFTIAQTFSNSEPASLKTSFLNYAYRALAKIADLAGFDETALTVRARLKDTSAKCLDNSAFAALFTREASRAPAVLLCNNPLKLYSTGAAQLKDTTDELQLPEINHIQDIAIGDFNADNRHDLYLVRAQHWKSQVVQPDKSSIDSFLVAGHITPKTVSFSTSDNNLQFTIHGDFNITGIHIGTNIHKNAGNTENKHTIRLNIKTEDALSYSATETLSKNHVYITFDNHTGLWKIVSTARSIRIEVKTDDEISNIKTQGFSSATGALQDRLLLSRGNGYYSNPLPDQTEAGACHSAVTADFDNDMDLDIYLACSAPAQNIANILYENQGDGTFTQVINAAGAAGSMVGRADSVTTADYNNDGFVDLLVTNGRGEFPGPVQLFKNNGNNNHWLEIELKGVQSNHDATGTHVQVEVNGKKQYRLQSGGMHRYAQNHQRLHFGLGKHTTVDSITITWPSGVRQKLTDVPADQILRVIEP